MDETSAQFAFERGRPVEPATAPQRNSGTVGPFKGQVFFMNDVRCTSNCIPTKT